MLKSHGEVKSGRCLKLPQQFSAHRNDLLHTVCGWRMKAISQGYAWFVPVVPLAVYG